ncbi:transposable element Tcb2 transposase [Trichonephila clavipes]|nr:transposable element Tcb2 transposase [Trichonephila clavipes]
MPDKRARRHFSQLSEFERGLIIGMRTAGWSTRRAAGQVDRSECAVRNCWEQWTREGTHARKTGFGATRKITSGTGLELVTKPATIRCLYHSATAAMEDHEERGSKDRAASTCGPHSDSFNDTSRCRRRNCPTNNFQTPCRSKS